MSKRWFTADTHFFHEAIMRFEPRPFKDAWEMNAVLIGNWNFVVADEDEVYIIGDFMWHKFEGVKLGVNEAYLLLNRLRGKKYLIRGNHDTTFSNKKWRKAGITDVFKNHTIFIGGNIVHLSHFPYIGYEHDRRRSRTQLSPDGNFLLHGHVHGSRPRYYGQKMINVSTEAWNYFPASEERISSIIEQSKWEV